ncbi:RHS repeat domain-containing protein [Bacteroides uniformis]|uniref:RHS repeat domain-containing protein n=1 Tax=Bacteroides uniformis TaxID=820 RepID=UPI0012D80E6C|nr:RHS repeat-associated core domain-containing protein [Bacteroides uniformis]
MLSIRNFSGQLSVIKTTDEDLNVSYTFTDKMGHVVLSRQMKGSETHDTYYVYDDKSNLCFVLQPMYQSSANLDLYAFQYKYDGRNRCIWKKLPGAGYMEMVYDNADRLVFSQDGNQRALTSGNWTYYKYDGLNRLTEQGTCTNKVTTSGTNVLVQHFYDSYAFRSQAGFNNSNFPDDASGNGKGALTASVATVLGSSNKIYTAYYYDIKGRVVKTVQSNPLGGYDVAATVYTFTNKPATVTHTHTASGKTTRTEVYTYSYDHADRLLKVEHTLGGTKITLADYAYDNLGRLQSKSLHGSATNKLTYAYNVRGWLTGISGSKFTQNLYYNTGTGTAKYNGSISSMTWKAGNESTIRGYKFTYDGLSRLMNATYGETAGINTNTNRFSENVTGYDKNGNIKTLQRYGQTAASSYGLIDNLTFTLAGNQLSRVDDAAAASAYNGGFEFKDGVKQANEYTYDSNGNLTKDLNKGISTITYNVLNLPNMVTFSDGSTIAYTYGADGTKLKTVHKTGSTTTTTDYCGNVVYENDVQKLLLTDEGYVTLSDGKYHYYLKDHQGNNRVVINQSGTVEEANHYYPFGGVFASSGNVQPYKYNGKEYDSKKGLNWYDYGARHYDAVLGRFTTNDRFAEKYYSMSPYQYGANSPVGNIDVNGDSIIIKPNANGIIDQIKVLFGYDTKFQKDVKADLFQLKQDDKKVADIIGKLEESKNIHYITMPKKGEYNSTGFNADKVKKNISQGSEIYYNPYNRRRGRNDSDMRTPRIGLAHELQHSFDVDKKVATYERTKNGILLMDIRAINTENRIRKVIGEPKRTMYGTQKVPKELLE